MAQILTEDDIATTSAKFLLKDIPDKLAVTENQIRMALRQKKYLTKWVMLKFMDLTTALVSVRMPRKSKNQDFTINLKGCTVKAIKLSTVEEDEFELMLNSISAQMFTSASSLRRAVEDTIKEMMQVENHNLFEGKKGDIKYDLLEATSKTYQVYPFGSRVTGLGYKNSDYDVFIDMDTFYRGGGETKLSNSVQHIRDMLRHNKAFSDIILIPRARVPVLKVKHQTTGIHCDISTLNGIGVENSKLLRNYLLDRKVRFVATTVKVWARQLGLTQAGMGPGAITSYCMLWLLLYALMQDSPPAVLSVLTVKQAYCGPKLFIDGWDCSFCSNPLPKSQNSKNEIELLYYFFSFYSNMTLREMSGNVISPYLGKLIPIKEFVKTNCLSHEYENYKKQVRSDRFYEMSCDSIMCVQDPIEQGHNIAKGVEDWVLDRFLKLCKSTAELMKDSLMEELHYIRPPTGVK